MTHTPFENEEEAIKALDELIPVETDLIQSHENHQVLCSAPAIEHLFRRVWNSAYELGKNYGAKGFRIRLSKELKGMNRAEEKKPMIKNDGTINREWNQGYCSALTDVLNLINKQN